MGDTISIPDEETFVEFIQTGRLGPLHQAMSEQELQSLLGEPDQRFVKNWPDSQREGFDELVILFYRNLGLTYQYGRLWFTTIDYRGENLGLPKELEIRWCDTVMEMSLDAFRHFLRKRQIPYKRAVLPPVWENSFIFVLDSGTEVVFDVSNDNKLVLIAFDANGPSGRPLEEDVDL